MLKRLFRQFNPPFTFAPTVVSSLIAMSYTKQEPMTLGGGNRNAKNLPVEQDGRAWSNGLCDCCGDAGTCVVSCFCPCIVYSKVKQRYEHLERNGSPDPEHGGGVCSADCMLFCCLNGVLGIGFVLQMFQRGNTRTRYNIKGGALGDCCTALFCMPCDLTQESREIELEEQSFKH